MLVDFFAVVAGFAMLVVLGVVGLVFAVTKGPDFASKLVVKAKELLQRIPLPW